MNSHDYIQTGLSFFIARKPFFEEQGNGRCLTANTPIARPSEVNAELESKYFWRPRLFEYLRRTHHIFAAPLDPGNANKTFFGINDRRVASILGLLQAETEKSGAKLLVVLVPGAHSFKNERTRVSYEKLPIPIHMTAILADLGIPLINLFRELPKRAEFEEIYGSNFVRTKDGSLGHPSAKKSSDDDQKFICFGRIEEGSIFSVHFVDRNAAW